MGTQPQKFTCFQRPRDFSANQAAPKDEMPQKSAKDHKEYKQYKPLSLYSLRSFFGKTIRLLTCTQKEGI
jgi:hypothetical protein